MHYLAQPHFNQEFPLADGRNVTQPIHKEWPETVPDPGFRRGNFDLSILPPDLIRSAGVVAFRNGDIAPPIVIEMGLDYNSHHLAKDAEKLIQSKVPHGYLVHFTRKGKEDAAERLVCNPGTDVPVRAAYACTLPSERYKLVRGDEILSKA